MLKFSPRRYLQGTWDAVRGYLVRDLEDLQSSINQNWNQIVDGDQIRVSALTGVFPILLGDPDPLPADNTGWFVLAGVSPILGLELHVKVSGVVTAIPLP